jgi:hypothetical protein
LPASAATITAVGSLAQNSGSGKSTLAVTPQHVGDALVLSIGVFPSSPTVSSVSGGGSTWSRVSYTTVSGDIEEWLGTITTTGSSTITVTFSGSISGKQDELLAQEFSSSTGSSTTWALDVAGHSTTSSNSTTVTMPALSPAGSGELYVDYSAVDNSGAAGSTSGFTYDITSEGSIFAYNPSVSASVTPTASQSPTGTYTETAALLTATGSGGGGTTSTTTLTASPSSPQNPSTSITLTATVTTGATGTVNFELGGTSLSGCSAKTLSSNVATCTTTALVAGTNSFVAIYSGDSTYAGSTSSTLNYVGLTPQATLTVTSTSGSYGTPLTLTTSGGSGTGAVTYSTTNGTASGCSISSGALSSTSAGTCMVTATKASDGTYQSISSSATTVTLSSLTSSTTTLTASPSSPQNPGTSITLTATVTTGATGTVNFELGGTSLSGCSAQSLSSSVATCVTTALAPGANSFVAVYSGNSTYAGSTSSTLTYTGLVPSAPGSVSVAASNGNVKVSWTVGGTVAGVTVVGYTATAYSGASAVGTCTMTVLGSTPLSCTIPNLPLSTSLTFSVTASSKTATGPSTSATSPLTLSLLTSTITLSALQLTPQNLLTPITFAATVTAGATGTVEFEDGASVIPGCQYRIVNSGYATCTTASLTAAGHTINAIYSGDANYATSSTSLTGGFTISSTTLTAATAPLLVTSTGAAINTTISLVVTGGNGSGAVLFGVVNGSASGCSISGTTLSVPSNVSGTCLVTATQASAGTYLGDVSNVATENFFWNYATYPYSYYVCSSGDTLSGSTCTHETYLAPAYLNDGYYCSSGWSGPISGELCWRDANVSQATCTANGGTWEGTYCYLTTPANYGNDGGAFGYYCLSGDTLIGTSCYSVTTYSATVDTSYSCPYGGSLSGMICSISGGSGPNLRLPRRGSLEGITPPPGEPSSSIFRSSKDAT